MKTKITLFLTFNIIIFICNGLNAQTVSGISSNTGCQNSGIITSSTTELGATPQYQLLKAGIAVSPVSGDNTQFTSDPVFTGLSSGTYVVNARATSVGAVFSSSNIIVTDGYTAMAVVTPTKVANCVGGTAALTSTITNGKAPFVYSIAAQASPGVILQNSGSVNSNTFTFNALVANSYIVSVTDACGQTITGATSISNPTIGLADIKLGSIAFPMFNTLFDCSSPLAIRNELLFQYVANSTTISASDAANFTWKIKYYGQLYGKDTNGDGYSDIGGDGYSPLLGTIRMPLIADKDGILADISNMRAVLIDNCGKCKRVSNYPIRRKYGSI